MVLEYLEFTQLSNRCASYYEDRKGFRVPGIYTALKRVIAPEFAEMSFRVPGIYTALKHC